MFKKKNKKDQGVLLAEETQNQTNTLASDPNVVANQQCVKSSIDASSPTINRQTEVQTKTKSQNAVGSTSLDTSKLQGPENYKRGRTTDLLYLQDASQNLQNEPKQIENALLKLPRGKTGLSTSTLTRKQETSRQVHQAFDGISHRAGTSLIKDMNLPEDELEEEAAKRLYLQNVEKTRLIKEGKLNSKIYRGMNSYANYKLTTNDIINAQDSYKKIMGPSRLNSTIKNTCRFDYVQNICKDWHDSGYCPFGNSCLYLHDRSNVKTGWELEKEFEQQERERWKRINNPELAKKQDREKLLKTIEKYRPPSSCENCQQPFKDPVEVECGHIFCTPCALKLIKCRICSKRLSGLLNSATEKIAKMTQNYEELLAKLENERQETQQKRRKFENSSSLDVFAD